MTYMTYHLQKHHQIMTYDIYRSGFEVTFLWSWRPGLCAAKAVRRRAMEVFEIIEDSATALKEDQTLPQNHGLS